MVQGIFMAKLSDQNIMVLRCEWEMLKSSYARLRLYLDKFINKHFLGEENKKIKLIKLFYK